MGLNLSYCFDIIDSLYRPFEITRGRLRKYILLSIFLGLLNLIPISVELYYKKLQYDFFKKTKVFEYWQSINNISIDNIFIVI